MQISEPLKNIIDGIITVEKNDINNENANMSSMTPAGQMMRFASEVSKMYALENLISPKFAEAHQKGEIHIHDLDYYPSKTTTCLQYDLADMFEHGFQTKHGYIREAKSISTYATLATIIFQTNQNEQHGGQAIPAFDFYMAKGVLKSFRRHFRYRILSFLSLDYVDETNKKVKSFINENIHTILPDDNAAQKISEHLNIEKTQIKRLLEIAYDDTRLETYQAMEGFLHNLNTMHSRGGNQVVFSSINYGTDYSEEGRMVIRELLKATEDGLGKRETPIFPIQIFKVKEVENNDNNDNNDNNEMNTYIKDNIKLEINTVHGVKGETHLATLYLDTFWYKYDISHYLIKLLSSKLTNKQKNNIQNIKRNRNIFVGASRATHLLCFACKGKKVEMPDVINEIFEEIIEIKRQETMKKRL